MAIKTAREKIEDILQIPSGWVGNKITAGNAEVEIQKYKDNVGTAKWQWGLYLNTTCTTHLDGGWALTLADARKAGIAALQRFKLT